MDELYLDSHIESLVSNNEEYYIKRPRRTKGILTEQKLNTEVNLEFIAAHEQIQSSINKLNEYKIAYPQHLDLKEIKYIDRVLHLLLDDIDNTKQWLIDFKTNNIENEEMDLNKRLFLMEASILLMLPYVFNILSKKPRSMSIGSTSPSPNPTNPNDNRSWDVAYQVHSDYEVKYDGVK